MENGAEMMGQMMYVGGGHRQARGLEMGHQAKEAGEKDGAASGSETDRQKREREPFSPALVCMARRTEDGCWRCKGLPTLRREGEDGSLTPLSG